jgi:tRNA-dihydrouridine synthase 3
MVKAAEESLFGFQVATKSSAEGAGAARLAAEAGASWLDLNSGCPIEEATRRGMGAALLRKPQKLAKLVHALVLASPLPVRARAAAALGPSHTRPHPNP